MKDREIVRLLMEKQGVTNAAMARRLGISDAAVWDRLNNQKAKNLTTSTLTAMLEPLGYRLVAVPAVEPVPEAGYLVE